MAVLHLTDPSWQGDGVLAIHQLGPSSLDLHEPNDLTRKPNSISITAYAVIYLSSTKQSCRMNGLGFVQVNMYLLTTRPDGIGIHHTGIITDCILFNRIVKLFKTLWDAITWFYVNSKHEDLQLWRYIFKFVSKNNRSTCFQHSYFICAFADMWSEISSLFKLSKCLFQTYFNFVKMWNWS